MMALMAIKEFQEIQHNNSVHLLQKMFINNPVTHGLTYFLKSGYNEADTVIKIHSLI